MGADPAAFRANGGGLAAKKKSREWRTVEAADIRHGRGRPGHLTPELADALVAQLAGGAGLAEAARACGVGTRTLRTWRRRAWSPRAADAPYVDLEKRILRALPKGAAEAPPSWEEAAAALEREHPERWALPDLDDVLGKLE